ncbi:type II toxin-antitoxin system VapC family toxin [Cylindrospermopsis sp. CR12]|uniref:type II toxin-antitoxin system VapC family toxin n=1 Tax=Cylindrospermopsis TaxID=77021 RepID=UPI00092E6447|nr:PIN domain-containing protein [Cylindrospermopsis sp. CR12]
MNKISVSVDTSFLLALGNKHDDRHAVAKQHFSRLRLSNYQFIILDSVLTETFYLLGNRTSHNVSQQFLSSLCSFADSGFVMFFSISSESFSISRIKDISAQFNDKPLDFVDYSLVWLAEYLNNGNILSFDNDFDIYRWHRTKPFHNLLRS